MRWSNLDGRVRRTVVIAAVTALTGALLGGGYLWFEKRSPGHRLAEACGGMLPVDLALDMTGTTASGFGGRDLELTSWGISSELGVVEPEGLAVTCRMNGIVLKVETASGVDGAWGDYTFYNDDDVLPVPLGSGWSGFVVAEEEDELGASVLLDCPNWDRKHGSGILVTVENEVADSGDESSRAKISRLATGTAARAAEQTGCAGEPGEEIEKVDGLGTTEAKQIEEATGTCAGLTSRQNVWETAADTAPVEYCVLERGLKFRADYGPFAESGDESEKNDYGTFSRPAGVHRDLVWGSAKCTGANGVGVYVATPQEGSDRTLEEKPLTAAERKDLRTFAERSAERHGCSEPALPSPPD